MNTQVITSSLVESKSITTNTEQLFYPVVNDGIAFFGFGVISRDDGASVAIPKDILTKLYFDAFRKQVSPVFNKALKNLMNIRNQLLLQLDLECGNITEDYFDKEEVKLLSNADSASSERMQQDIRLLLSVTDLALDSEEISEIMNCSIDDAEIALKAYLNEGYHAGA